jgi:hypothetical protein
VKDLTAATEQARKLGATVVREDVQVPNEGRFSWIVDPAGAPLGLWEPMARRTFQGAVDGAHPRRVLHEHRRGSSSTMTSTATHLCYVGCARPVIQ